MKRRLARLSPEGDPRLGVTRVERPWTLDFIAEDLQDNDDHAAEDQNRAAMSQDGVGMPNFHVAVHASVCRTLYVIDLAPNMLFYNNTQNGWYVCLALTFANTRCRSLFLRRKSFWILSHSVEKYLDFTPFAYKRDKDPDKREKQDKDSKWVSPFLWVSRVSDQTIPFLFFHIV